jgi:serine/threonine protein kinase
MQRPADAIMSNHEKDRNLLFGVLALQADLVDSSQFAEACAVWSSQKDLSLAAILVQRGWLSESDRSDVDRLVKRKLKKHANDVKTSLAEAAAPVQHLLTGVSAGDIQRSLADLPPKLAAPTRSVMTPADGEASQTTAYEPLRQSRYTMVRLHARGGLGRVWVAHDDQIGRDVALKELLPELAASKTLQARFLREARITGQLEHPGIVPLYELIPSQDGRPCYTMRFVKGRTLSEAIKNYHQTRIEKTETNLGLRDLLTSFLGVCHAVAFAHSRDVIHRDLKGSNVILGDFGEVMLLDWGLAKDSKSADPAADDAATPASETSVGALHTMAGQVLGTPAYMAPEQAAGEIDRISNRTDVYSLGVILYEILTGNVPFPGADTPAVLRQVLNEEPPPPRHFNRMTPPALEAICRKAMAKRPEDRFASVEEMSGDIRHWLADEPVSCFRENRASKIRRWARRNRVLVAALIGLELAGVLAFVGGLTLYLVSRSRIRAMEERGGVALSIAKNSYQFSNLSITEEEGRTSILLARKRIYNLASLIKHQEGLSQTLPGAFDESLPKLYFDLGRARAQTGLVQESIEPLEKARTLFEQPGKTEKATWNNKSELLSVFMQLGQSLIEAGRPGEAVEVLKSGDQVAEEISNRQLSAAFGPQGPPESAIFIRGRMATALRQAGKPDESRIQYRRTIDTAREYEKRYKKGRILTYAGYEIGLFQMGAGVLEHQQGRLDEAGSLYRDAESNQRKAATSTDNTLSAYDYMQFRGALANTLYWSAVLELDRGSPAEAQNRAQESLDLLIPIHKSHSALAYLRFRLARAHLLIGEIHLRSGQHAAALASYRAGLDIIEALQTDAPNYVDGLSATAEAWLGIARAQKMLKQPEAEKKAVTNAVVFAFRASETDPLARYLHARVLAYPGQPDDALTALREARDAGWSNPLAVRYDPCWDGMRKNPDLEKLLRELEPRSK